LRESRDLLFVILSGRATRALCHPERDAFCPAKDLGAPRESPALFAGEENARLARFLIYFLLPAVSFSLLPAVVRMPRTPSSSFMMMKSSPSI
jgi:hypothetical protein